MGRLLKFLKENWSGLFLILLFIIYLISSHIQQSFWVFLEEVVLLIIGYSFLVILQKKKNRPEIITHGCRIMDIAVYTYFDPDNNNSEPACPYLSDGGECKFKPTEQNSKSDYERDNKGQVIFWGIEEKKHMLNVNNGRCYLTLWNQKTKQK